MKKLSLILVILSLLIVLPVAAQDGDENRPDPLGGADSFSALEEETDVRLMLDWTANTNHIGFYVAQARGYYAEANLKVEIIEPTEFFPEQALDNGLVEFGVGFQDFSTPAMSSGAEIVSVAAIIQNNTSGFATLAEDYVLESPSDLAPLRYGGFGLPDLENAMIRTLLACDNATWNEGNYIEIGLSGPDVIALMERNRVDFGWIFYGWQGLNAELEGNELSRLMLMDYQDCVPNYYTPILLTSREMIENNPSVVRAFVEATARGYADAILNPSEAADRLLEAVPELDEDLVRASAEYLALEFQADAPRWGQQSSETWEAFTQFLIDNGIIEEWESEGYWTNEFLPGTVDEES